MATLNNTRISDTYFGLIKTIDNAVISATLKQLTDGSGNATGLYINNAGDFKVNSVLEFGSLKDTGENIVITKFVDQADGIANNNNDTSIPTSKAVKDYVDTHVTAQDLDFKGDDNAVAGDVDLDSESFQILGTANEIETAVVSAGGTQLRIGIVTNPTLSGNVTITGDLNISQGEIINIGSNFDLYATASGEYIQYGTNPVIFNGNADVIFRKQGSEEKTAVFTPQGSAKLYHNNNLKLETTVNGLNVTGKISNLTDPTANQDAATKAYVDSLDAGSDLDFGGDSGTGDVNLNAQTFLITGTSNQITTSASGQELTLSLPSTVHRNLQGNVTGNLTGNVTGNVTGDITGVGTLSNGSTAITQSAGDNSTKIATTAYVDSLDAASDLDFGGDSGTGAVVLNTQTFSIIGTANEVETSASNQQLQIGLPSSINVNSASATILQTARDISLTGEASATISSFNGSSNVSGAVTLDNNSVTGKVLTGLASPTASNILASDSILEAFGKTQSQLNTLAGGLRFMGTWNANTNTPTLQSGGGEADSGTTTGTATNKLIQSGQNFTSTVTNGDKVINQSSGATALVTNVDSNTQLTLDADIMVSGQEYTIDNSPFITQGHYFVVSVGGTSSLNGLSNWAVGDWVIAGAGNVWEKLDHTQVDGTGTAGNIAKFSSTNVIADSIMAESGSTINVTGTVNASQQFLVGSNDSIFAENNIRFKSSGAAFIDHNTTSQSIKFRLSSSSALDTTTLELTPAYSVFAGNVNVNSGDVILTTGKSFYSNGTTNGLRILHDGTNALVINQTTGDLKIQNSATDKDIMFRGQDGASTITALTLDMSEGGNATFLGKVQSTLAIDNSTLPDVPGEHVILLNPPTTTGYYGGGIGWSESSNTAASLGVYDDGSGGALGMYFATGTNASIKERMTIDKNGLVTIGALTSGETGRFIVNDEGGNTSVAKFASRTNRAIVQVSDNDTTGYLSAEGGIFSVGRAAGSNNNNINIENGGEVGFGTQAPNYRVDIYSEDNVGLRIHRPNSSLDSSEPGGIGFSTRSDSATSTTDTRSGIFSYYNGNLFFSANTSDITSNPYASARMIIQSSGNAMIGNSVVNPASGFASQKGFGYNATSGQVQMATTGDNSALELGRNHANDGSILTFRKQSNVMGTFGSNTTGGQALLDLKANQNFRIVTANTEVMRIDSSQRVGIGVSPSYKLQILETGGATTNIAVYANVQGSGTNNYAFYADATQGTSTNFAFYGASGKNYFAGDTGVGTDAPTEKLEVNGSMKLGNMKFQNASGGRIGFNRDTNNGNIYDSNFGAFQINGASTAAAYLECQAYNSSGGFTGSFVFSSGADFGIGLDNPGDYYGDKFVVKAPDENGITLVGTGANQKQYICFADGVVGAQAYSGYIAYDHNNDSMTFANNGGNARMTIKSDGKVSVSDYVVGSQGNQTIYGQLSSFANSETDNLFLGLRDGTYPNRGYAFQLKQVGVNSDFLIVEKGGGSGEVLRIKSNGNVGIGTADGPGDVNAKLHVYKQAGDNTVQELLRLDCGENNHNVGKGGAIVFRDINVYTDTAKIIAQRIGNTGGSTLQFALRGTEKMRIHSSDYISFPTIQELRGDISAGKFAIGNMGDSTSQTMLSSRGFITFNVSNTGSAKDATERMRINATGHLLFNLSDYSSEPTNKNFFIADATSGASVTIGGHSGTHTAVLFRHNGATTPGSISITTNSTSYNTSSDYRLKEDLQDFNGLEKVSDIKVYDFKWKADENRSYGVMAHELEKVLPQAVVGEKDAEKMQSVDYSKIVPLLVKSIQELKEEVDSLKKQCNCK